MAEAGSSAGSGTGAAIASADGVHLRNHDEDKPAIVINELTTDAKDVVEDGTIVEFGYTPVYRRVFRSLKNICMVVSLTSPLSAILVTASYQTTYGGYWGLSWGWIIPSILVFPQVLATAELASSMPVNGAFYWWSGALAPPRYANIVSFVSGWVNILSMFSATAAFVYAVASSLSFSVNVVAPNYVWTNSQMMGVSIAVLVVWAILMSLRLETISTIFIAMAGIVLVETLILIFALPISHKVQGLPFASGHDVFASYQNYSDWSAAVAVPYTWFAAMWVNSAWMCPVYVAEETHNASIETPKSIILTYSVTAASGVLVCLLCAFCITDMDAYGLDESGYPLVDLVVSHWGATLTAIFLFLGTPIGWLGGSGTLVTYAAQIAAFARDGGLPYKQNFSSVHKRLNQPVHATSLLVVGTCLILLFSLSPQASSIIYSLSVVTGLVTFLIPIALRIFAGARWVPGPYNLGRWSIPVHTFTVFVQAYIIVMECFPESSAVDGQSMNYNSALCVAAFVFSLILYYFLGNKFQGPNQEALAHWRAHHAGHASD